MPAIVRIKSDGPVSYTYGPTRASFDKGRDYVMSDEQARRYERVPELEVVYVAPKLAPAPLPTPVLAESKQIEEAPAQVDASPVPKEPDPEPAPEPAPVVPTVKRRGRPPKAR